MQAMTEEGNSIVTPFSDEIQTLPVGADPGKYKIITAFRFIQ